MKSKTKIDKQSKKKTNRELIETIALAKNNEKWREVAEVLTRPRKKIPQINLNELIKNSKEGKILIVPGKVLSVGEASKKVHVAAFRFSEKAKEKIIKAGGSALKIIEEINKNKEGKDIIIIKK